LRVLLGLHCLAARPRILDASWGHGRLWRGLPYRPVRFDVRAELDVDVAGNWRDLASIFPTASFDVVVWDPPHINDAGRNGIVGGQEWGDRYGTLSDGLRGENIAGLFPPFLEAARAILAPDGCLVAKIADQVHCGLKQLQHVDFVVAARELGWTVCECEPKPRSSTLADPKWRQQLHLRSTTFWLVAHPGPTCPGSGVQLVAICAVCGLPFRPRRSDARTHAGKCRQKAYRQRKSKR
jgi:hypothetical protein